MVMLKTQVTRQVLIRANMCNVKALAVGIYRRRKSPVGQRSATLDV